MGDSLHNTLLTFFPRTLSQHQSSSQSSPHTVQQRHQSFSSRLFNQFVLIPFQSGSLASSPCCHCHTSHTPASRAPLFYSRPCHTCGTFCCITSILPWSVKADSGAGKSNVRGHIHKDKLLSYQYYSVGVEVSEDTAVGSVRWSPGLSNGLCAWGRRLRGFGRSSSAWQRFGPQNIFLSQVVLIRFF